MSVNAPTTLGPLGWQDRTVQAADRLPAEYTLASLVGEICERVGMPLGTYDVGSLSAFVDGFMMTNEHPAYSGIQTLADLFFFDPSSFDGRLQFRHRGGNIVGTIDPDDVLESVDDNEELQRKDSLAVPRVLNLVYHDLNGGLQPNKQTSERSADNRSTGEINADTPIILRTSDAARIAVITHKVQIAEQRGEYHISVPDSYIRFTVGDSVGYRGERLRIFSVELDDGFQRFKLSFDRQEAYFALDAGVPPPPPTEPVPLDPGVTLIEVIDTQIITSGDDTLGYYFAVSGQSESWQGALIEFSEDGGETYTGSQITATDTLMGELLDPLPVHSRYFPDEVNTFRVQLHTPFSELQAASLREMMNRINLAIVGDELINFGEVDEIEPGVWEVSYLLRGRKGTSIDAHSIGERFIVMERNNMAYLPAEIYEIGQPLTFRATSIGGDEETVITHTFTAQSQTERAPVYLRAIRDGDDLSITWQGVGRIGGRTQIQHGQFFAGYTVEVDGVETETTATSFNTTVPGPVLIRVWQRNILTGAGPAIEVTA